MTPERWRQVEEIFQGALDRVPDQRTQYVLEACGNDETLRRDVQLLLSQHDSAGELLDVPLYGNTEMGMLRGYRRRRRSDDRSQARCVSHRA